MSPFELLVVGALWMILAVASDIRARGMDDEGGCFILLLWIAGALMTLGAFALLATGSFLE